MADSQFDKDFGYLMPFLDKVASAATSLADPAAREELTRLIGGEKQRWARIRELLSGAPAQPAARSSPATVGAPVDKPAAGSIAERRVFTVGSLRSSGADSSRPAK